MYITTKNSGTLSEAPLIVQTVTRHHSKHTDPIQADKNSGQKFLKGTLQELLCTTAQAQCLMAPLKCKATWSRASAAFITDNASSSSNEWISLWCHFSWEGDIPTERKWPLQREGSLDARYSPSHMLRDALPTNKPLSTQPHICHTCFPIRNTSPIYGARSLRSREKKIPISFLEEDNQSGAFSIKVDVHLWCRRMREKWETKNARGMHLGSSTTNTQLMFHEIVSYQEMSYQEKIFHENFQGKHNKKLTVTQDI